MTRRFALQKLADLTFALSRIHSVNRKRTDERRRAWWSKVCGPGNRAPVETHPDGGRHLGARRPDGFHHGPTWHASNNRRRWISPQAHDSPTIVDGVRRQLPSAPVVGFYPRSRCPPRPIPLTISRFPATTFPLWHIPP